MINYFSKRKNVMDENYVGIKNINERYNDVKIMYTTMLQTTSIELLNKYSVDYIYSSSFNKQKYGVENIRYADAECVKLIYEKSDHYIYDVKECKTKELEFEV
ncbi:hypothetical protein ACFL1H_07370 [Nanoarchaeota archaeon]